MSVDRILQLNEIIHFGKVKNGKTFIRIRLNHMIQKNISPSYSI